MKACEWLWLCLALVGCKRAADEPRPHASSAAAVVPGACFIGPLFENATGSHSRPDTYCVHGIRYTGASHRLGRRNVFGEVGDVDDGGYVRLLGTVEGDLYSALDRNGTCASGDGPMPQMRSDWPPEEGTYHTTLDALRGADFLRSSVRTRRGPS